MSIAAFPVRLTLATQRSRRPAGCRVSSFGATIEWDGAGVAAAGAAAIAIAAAAAAAPAMRLPTLVLMGMGLFAGLLESCDCPPEPYRARRIFREFFSWMR